MSSSAELPEASGTAPELSHGDLERLRAAAAWARFIAIVGFIGSALFALMVAVIVNKRIPASLGTGLLVIGAISVGAMTVGAGLLWSYAQNVAAFFTEGEPALVRAFRSLRYAVAVCTLTSAFDTATTILSLLGKL